MCGKTETLAFTRLTVTVHGVKSTQLKKTYLTPYDLLQLFCVTLLNFILTTHTYMPTSFWPHLPTNDVRTYIIFSTHILFFSHITSIPNYFLFPLLYLSPRVQIISLLLGASICTHALMSLFTIWLMQISTTALTHTNYLKYIIKRSHHHINRTTLAQLLQF